jgi:hypothetical protein
MKSSSVSVNTLLDPSSVIFTPFSFLLALTNESLDDSQPFDSSNFQDISSSFIIKIFFNSSPLGPSF